MSHWHDDDPYYVSPKYEQGYSDAESEVRKELTGVIENLLVTLDNLVAAALGLVPQDEIEKAWAAMKAAEEAI